MPTLDEIERWKEIIFNRYVSYLKTSFYFRDIELRESFERALRTLDEDESKNPLMKGQFSEPAREFISGVRAWDLAKETFPDQYENLSPALIKGELYRHQEEAIRKSYIENGNVVVASGTASGKTESFLYPILFDLYKQHIDGKLNEPGVRALILYPMNALANDQRRRLGEEICRYLKDAGDHFKPTFGQYIGETPNDKYDHKRGAQEREQERLPNELIYRKEMRDNPPHILLTNYSMLEYLLIRPEDSELFDSGRGRHWRFIVLDEAHQYRGVKGMEMGMLIRRLKQRLRDGGRKKTFSCIATSATLSTDEGDEDKKAVAEFAYQLFGEDFTDNNVIFGRKKESPEHENPRRFHLFLRALEGAFLSHQGKKDVVLLNREVEGDAKPLEVALCRECGQHYYVGCCDGGYLVEAIRDPGEKLCVEFYLPTPENPAAANCFLCRVCGKISETEEDLNCSCKAEVPVKKCETHPEHPDQLKECDACGYQRGSWGDPVQEIVHGSDGPNSVIVTALHGLLPEGPRRKILSFADSRQQAAFFAWYAEKSYNQVRDRNLILRALHAKIVDKEGLSLDDLVNRLEGELDDAELFPKSDTPSAKNRKAKAIVFGELVTAERRLSLSGVGLAKWWVKIPDGLRLPPALFESPWNFDESEVRNLLSFLLDNLRPRRALMLPSDADAPKWKDVSPRPGWKHEIVRKDGGDGTISWTSSQSVIIRHFLPRLLAKSGMTDDDKRNESVNLMDDLWDAIYEHDDKVGEGERILSRVGNDGFRLNPNWLRVRPVAAGDAYECDTCTRIETHNIRGVCPNNRCTGTFRSMDDDKSSKNHYRILYEDTGMPPKLTAEEHTAQLESREARKRQQKFKDGDIHLLSASTTFEVGVDLGDLETVFLRNVPPEPFNYTQRVGRAGRRAGEPGLALTYCRRNPHDLYHYANPKERILRGQTRPPQLHLRNKKIISRHIIAVALSAFFRHGDNKKRFKKVEDFIVDWNNPRAVADVRSFCAQNQPLEKTLRAIVPEDMHDRVGLSSGDWVEFIFGGDSRLALAEREVCDDYLRLKELKKQLKDEDKLRQAELAGRRMYTIASEQALVFLSRKAVIPKYGFPVDVVELDVRMSGDNEATKVSLQRDLSQAIAEYAPECRVIANKKEWKSCGVKVLKGKQLAIKGYEYNQERYKFQQWDEQDLSAGDNKYLSPEFGFVAPFLESAKEPSGVPRRLYTTRPFFRDFVDESSVGKEEKIGIEITEASPGKMVVLCEGTEKKCFYFCRECGAGFTGRKRTHKTPYGGKCDGTLECFALGHEFVTDVVRMSFPGLNEPWLAYSVAYGVLLGAAQALDVPEVDLNVTITGLDNSPGFAVVLYDNVPGGAGLVASLKNLAVLKETLKEAKERVAGDCGCDESCYGCLRSYRNQFAHPHLRRIDAHDMLCGILDKAD